MTPSAIAPATTNGKGKAKNVKAPEAQEPVTLQELALTTYEVPIIGVSPLIPHKWSEKAKKLMRDKQSGSAARPKKEPKDPDQEAEAATYRLDDGRPGMPATAFKAAIVDAARHYDGVTMVGLRLAVYVHGEGAEQLVPIEGDSYTREDTPRNATGVADLRYRRCFTSWRTTLHVEVLQSVISDASSVINLINAAGLGGVGDWRPSSPKSKTGTYGRFRVDQSREIRVIG